jgi:hypothetical protein
MCLYAKRLERWRFSADDTVTITPAPLSYLLEGIDWRCRSGRCGRKRQAECDHMIHVVDCEFQDLRSVLQSVCATHPSFASQ